MRFAKLNGFRQTLARQYSAFAGFTECTVRRGTIAIDRAGRNFQRFVVPHLCFCEQSPAFKGIKYRALAAQRFYRPVANEILHFSPPTSLPTAYLKPNSRQCHYDSRRLGEGTLAPHGGYSASD